MKEQNKTVMVFGVFDGFHPGHRAFLKQAERYGKKLIVVVARNSAVRKLKKKEPILKEKKRLVTVRKIKEVTRVILGDRKQSSYAVIKKYKPDVVCLGYDQRWLEKDLRDKMRLGKIPRILFIRLKPYQADKFHSSFIKL